MNPISVPNATPRFALILRRLRSRFGIAAPQVSVRTQVPWYMKAAVFVGVLALFALTAYFSYESGRLDAGFDKQGAAKVETEHAALEEEILRMRSLLTASESTLQIERASQKLLSEKNGVLVAENSKLREELAVFERLTKVEGAGVSGGVEVVIDQVSIRQEAAKGQYRFGFLIAMQGARRGKEARFDLQIRLTPRGQQQATTILLPGQDEPDRAQYEIVMRNFRRIEGRFSVPATTEISVAEIRILEAGVVKASKSLTI